MARAGEGAPALGTRIAADILKVAAPALEAHVLAALEAASPRVAAAVRSLLVTFEDLVGLEDRTLQEVLKEVSREELLLALKTASPAMRAKIFGNLPHRAAELFEEDLGTMARVPLRRSRAQRASWPRPLLRAERRIAPRAGDGDALV
jgi:flagellar motor switch protein FliG